MSWFAQMVLLAWLPVVLIFFLVLSPRKAVVAGLIGSWLFLPEIGWDVPLAPDYTKMTATCYAIILGGIFLDPQGRVLKFRPSWVDIPMVIWCTTPLITAFANIPELTLYDGVTGMIGTIITDGLPYLIGRLYFRTPEDAKALVMGILIGAILYMPLCLYEVRMSPQLHKMIYGVQAYTDWAMAKRWGGWRPTVFMRHGLAVGIWMAAGASVAFWMWRTKAVKQIWRVPMIVIMPALLITVVLVKSSSAVAITGMVLIATMAVHYFRTNALLWALVLGIPFYLTLRATQVIDVTPIAKWMVTLPGDMSERGESLLFRLDHENAIGGRAFDRPLAGWGGYGRAFDVYLPDYNSFGVPDSMWIRSFGQNGFIGLISMYAAFLIGPILLLAKIKPREWDRPEYAPVSALVMIALIYALDSLFNNMSNPVFIVAFGAVAGMGASISRRRSPASVPVGTPGPRPLPADEPPADEDDSPFPDDDDDSPILLDLPSPRRDDPLGGSA